MSGHLCPSCLITSHSHVFLQHHIIDEIITIYGHPQTGSNIVIKRNCHTHDFRCPWPGCSFRHCDSVRVTDHVAHLCPFRQDLSRGM